MKLNTYYIITIGCQMNKSDSERVAGYLSQQGWEPAKDYSRAELVVVNTCGVRQSAEDRIYGLIPRIRRVNPQVKIVLTGCLVYREDVKKKVREKVDIWLPITELMSLKEGIQKEKRDHSHPACPDRSVGACPDRSVGKRGGSPTLRRGSGVWSPLERGGLAAGRDGVCKSQGSLKEDEPVTF